LLLFAPVAFAATYGDINDDGDVDVLDVVLVMKHVLDLDELTTAQKAVADVNGDGPINVQDVTLIMQKSLGLIDEFPHAALTVSKVTAVNPKQVEVEFNRMLNTMEMEDIILANFHVGLQAAPATNVLTGTGSAVAVQDDNKTVLLTLGGTSKFASGTISNRVVVKKAVGLEADFTNSAIAFIDTAVPTLVSVQSVSPTTIVLTFSEPLDKNITPTVNDIVLNNGTVAINLAAAEYVDSQRELRINAFAKLTAGEYTLTIKSGNNLKDYSGFGLVPGSKTFTHAIVTTAPTVSVKSSNERSVTIQFSREIDPDSLVNNIKVLFRHTYDSTENEVDGTSVVAANGDNKLFTITFGDGKLLPPGSTTMWLKYVTGATDAQKILDTWDNVVAPVSLTVTTTPDTTPPTATVTVVSNEILDVQYSEEVNGALTKGNYSIKQGSDTVEIDTVALAPTGTNRYRITTVDKMQGNYTLTISNIKDKSPAQNAMVTKIYNFSVEDTISPKVVNLSGAAELRFYWQSDLKKVRIFFNEPMNTTDLENKTLYGNVAHSSKNPTSASAASDGKSVYLVFADDVSGSLIVGSLKDLAGNSLGISTTLLGLQQTVGLDLSVTPAANRVIATSPTTLKLYLNDYVVNALPADFEIRIETGPEKWVVPSGISYSYSGGKTVITLTLSASDALAYNALDNNTAATQVRTVITPGTQGNTANAENQFGVPVNIIATNITDKIPPVLTKAEWISISEIKLTFSEDLDATTFASTLSNGFSVSGTVIRTNVVDNIVTVTKVSGNNFTAGTSTISYSSTSGGVTDENENALATFGPHTVPYDRP
jgi:hypothetical protein